MSHQGERLDPKALCTEETLNLAYEKVPSLLALPRPHITRLIAVPCVLCRQSADDAEETCPESAYWSETANP